MRCMARNVVFVFILGAASFEVAFGDGYIPPLDLHYLEETTSNFGAQGDDYQEGGKVWHCGWDIFCPEGELVKSPADGIVVRCSPSSWDLDTAGQNYAMCIRYLTTTSERSTWIFGHLERPTNPDGTKYTDEQVRKYRIGDVVRAGEVIGKIGHYRKSPHLHLGIYCNLQYPQEFPSGGYGRQPLPRPDADGYRGVLRYGNWFDPRGWLETFAPAKISGFGVDYECLLPAAANDSKHFFYVRQNQTEQILMMAEPDGKDSVSIWQIPAGHQAVDIFAGPAGSLFVKTRSAEERSLFWIKPGKEQRLLLINNGDFGIGHWRADANYLPIHRQMKWEVFDLVKNTIRPRAEVMVPGTGGALDKMFGQVWRLLGSDIDFVSGKSRLVCWIISATEQHKYWIETTFSASNFTDLIVLESHSPVDPKETEQVVFSASRGGLNHNLFLGLLVPINADATHNGYRLENVRQLTTGPDDKIGKSLLRVGGKMVILAQVQVGGKWQVFRLDIDGKNFQQLTGLSSPAASTVQQGPLRER